MRGPDGQVLLELTATASLLLVLVAGAGWVLKASWDRGRCAYIVFESTRRELSEPGRSRSSMLLLQRSPVSLEWHETADELRGRGRCGNQEEQVGFRKLESLREWR